MAKTLIRVSLPTHERALGPIPVLDTLPDNPWPGWTHLPLEFHPETDYFSIWLETNRRATGVEYFLWTYDGYAISLAPAYQVEILQ